MNNIGIKKTNRKYINILDKNIPTFKNQVKLLDYDYILHKKYKLNEGNSIIGIYESEILKVDKIIEIRRLLDISFYSKLSSNFWKKFDYKKDMDNFFILVDNLVNDKYDKIKTIFLFY